MTLGRRRFARNRARFPVRRFLHHRQAPSPAGAVATTAPHEAAARRGPTDRRVGESRAVADCPARVSRRAPVVFRGTADYQ